MHSNKSVGKYISILYRHAQTYITAQMKNYHIGGGQYMFLAALYQQDGVSQEELSQSLMIDKGTTARAVGKLEAAGYVIRKPNTEDKRAYQVFLTQKAKEIEPVLHGTLSSMTDIFITGLSEKEKEQLFIMLDKMMQNIMRYTKSADE